MDVTEDCGKPQRDQQKRGRQRGTKQSYWNKRDAVGRSGAVGACRGECVPQILCEYDINKLFAVFSSSQRIPGGCDQESGHEHEPEPTVAPGVHWILTGEYHEQKYRERIKYDRYRSFCEHRQAEENSSEYRAPRWRPRDHRRICNAVGTE